MELTIKETTRLLLQGNLTKDEADKILLDLFDVSNSVCSCRPNTDLYCKTITYCNKCHKEVKTVRTN